ncbi:MAG: glycine oxidase ThiO [Cyanobacteriota bacterium]|nr:glycine oxidase ThiO [Cyanobacteriota bacterium]
MNGTSDILIIGGGIIGLSIAIELKLRGADVTVISRNFEEAATNAAGGMLAPGAERIPSGAMFDLCWRSLDLYPEWISKLEEIAGKNTGYWPCGILTPVCDLEPGEKSQFKNANCQWLDRDSIHQRQPGLNSEVIGGWWYGKDAQVDNRLLFATLQEAAKLLKINLIAGIVGEIIEEKGRVKKVKSSGGDLSANSYVLAAGSWCNRLMSVPVIPRKGEMLSLIVPQKYLEKREEGNIDWLPLKQVLYGKDGCYIIPRLDGRIVIGATSEDVGFSNGNTVAGIQTLLGKAVRSYPVLKDFKIDELWWGFRPATPDEMPILGYSDRSNLILATGHYRNGILLAPVTAMLIANLIGAKHSDPLLDAFDYSRFAR